MHPLIPIQNVLMKKAQNLASSQPSLFDCCYNPIQGIKDSIVLLHVTIDVRDCVVMIANDQALNFDKCFLVRLEYFCYAFA